MNKFICKYFLQCLILLALSGIFYSCTSDATFEHTIDLPVEGWKEDNALSYNFEIADKQPKYDFYTHIRYSNDYRFFNNYVQYELIDSAGKIVVKHLDQFILFDEKTGKPIGDGIGGTYDITTKLYYLNNYQFPYAGKFTFTIRQYMRITPLQGIKAIGVEVKKI